MILVKRAECTIIRLQKPPLNRWDRRRVDFSKNSQIKTATENAVAVDLGYRLKEISAGASGVLAKS